MITEQDEVRFWGGVHIPHGGFGCWEWQRRRDRCGYGTMTISKKRRSTHRLAWQIVHGAIPHGLFVCHHCDNPSCCNPSHLFLGSHMDNVQDSVRKGRMARTRPLGEQHGMAKLDTSQVIRIYTMCLSGSTHTSLSQTFGVSRRAIISIHSKRTWKHITDTLDRQGRTV